MKKIAIVGATGLVGRMLVKILKQEKINAEYIFFSRTPGREVKINAKVYKTLTLSREAAEQFCPEFVFFSAGAEVSKSWAPIFAELGAIVIDNSSAFRRKENVPLIVPECNAHVLVQYKKANAGRGFIISNPNCSTIGAVVALKPLHDRFVIKRVVYSTYQAISGAGANPKFNYPIKNNLIPYIRDEEEKMIFETKKILGKNNMAVSATCVRVPVQNCHCVSVNVEFKKKASAETVKKVLLKVDGVVLVDGGDGLAMPLLADNKNEVFVGRIRTDKSRPNCVNLFTASDNIRKGAAYNAFQIFRLLT